MKDDTKQNNGDAEEQLRSLNGIFLLFMLLAAIATIAYTILEAYGQPQWVASGLQHGAVASLWALASLAVGAFVGMLFGIPRMRQTNSTSQADNTADKPEMGDKRKYQPEINNNLIEVSDWLTKIIVGLGLVELRELPDKLKIAANPLAECLGGECGLALAVGVIIFFLSAGFLVGYINARTFLAVMFRRSDDALLSEVDKLKLDVAKTVVKQEAQQVTSDLRLQKIQTFGQQFHGISEQTTPPDPQLVQMAKEYGEIHDPQYRERVARKDQAATRMVHYIFEKKYPKNLLLSWAEANPIDGLIVAFASYVLAIPEPGDLGKLLQIAPKAEWLHVKFRVTLAIRQLCRSGFWDSKKELKEALTLLEAYHKHAAARTDQSLLAITEEAMDIIDPYLH